jgi:hypothetical protein
MNATAFAVLAFSLQPLAFASVAEIIGKFGGADQFRNAVNLFHGLPHEAESVLRGQ